MYARESIHLRKGSWRPQKANILTHLANFDGYGSAFWEGIGRAYYSLG